jgi:hypothetical protein
MRSLALAATFVLASLPLSASAQKVLVIPDEDQAGSTVVAQALMGAGMNVTIGVSPSYTYNGANPPLGGQGYDVVVLLSGGPGPNSANIDMPGAGQTAITNFVAGGGGLVLTEWAAYQVANNRWQTLKPLVIVGRTSGTTGFIDYNVTPAFQNHPLWANVPQTFQFSTATNVGVVIPQPGAVRVATSKVAGDVVALRDAIGAGRIVYFSTAGNFSPMTWTNVNLQTLVVNACKWASASRVNNPPKASAGGPYTVGEGSTVLLTANCMDPDGDQTTATWDLNNDNVFGDANGLTVTFDAAMRDGPGMQTVQVKCTDTGMLSATASSTITIQNVPPRITSNPPSSASEGVLYSYDAQVFDPGPNDAPVCALTSGPMGMMVDQQCHVRWLPTYDQARFGQVMVTISVTDKDGGKDTQTWTIAVKFIDSDGDGLPDTWEKMFFGNLLQGAGGDPDMDGRPNLKEYQDGTDPTKYDGPTAPTVVSPKGGVSVMTLKPTLVVANAKEPTNDPLTYEFLVYSDAQLTNLIDVALAVPEGVNQTSSVVKTALVENQKYYWRCRARDPWIASPWSATESFVINAMHDPPTAPGIVSPMDGAKVKQSHPNLIVTNATSPDGLKLTYEFELYSDVNLVNRVEAKVGVIEGNMGQTSYLIATDLTAYGHYWWRARATDEQGLSGKWSLVPTFEVFPNNPSPSPPVFDSPKDGARLATLSPQFVFGGSVDVDMEPITYQCDLDRTNTFDTAAKQSVSGLMPDMNNKASWTPSNMVEENKRYCLRCRAKDPSGASTYAVSCFLIDVKNDPPSVPTLTNPSDQGMAAGSVVVYTWVNSIDPEGDPIHYEIEVYKDAGMSQMAGAATGGDGPVGVTLTGFDPGQYWWRARAIDALGAESGWSAANMFTAGAYTPPAYHGGCGCRVGGRAAAMNLYMMSIFAMVGLVVARRRRLRATASPPRGRGTPPPARGPSPPPGRARTAARSGTACRTGAGWRPRGSGASGRPGWWRRRRRRG